VRRHFHSAVCISLSVFSFIRSPLFDLSEMSRMGFPPVIGQYPRPGGAAPFPPPAYPHPQQFSAPPHLQQHHQQQQQQPYQNSNLGMPQQLRPSIPLPPYGAAGAAAPAPFGTVPSAPALAASAAPASSESGSNAGADQAAAAAAAAAAGPDVVMVFENEIESMVRPTSSEFVDALFSVVYLNCPQSLIQEHTLSSALATGRDSRQKIRDCLGRFVALELDLGAFGELAEPAQPMSRADSTRVAMMFAEDKKYCIDLG
jgi:hypothetical protein